MSSRYGFSARGGLSPFASTLGQGGVPSVTDDDFSYITSEDIETFDIPRIHGAHEVDGFYNSVPAPVSNYDQRRPADDVMLIRYKEVTYPERFPAFSIGDGKLQVDDVIERVKMIMHLTNREARRMRLFYKGRQLKELKAPIREYGVKNNSEVMVVLGEPSGDSSGESSEEIVVVGREGYNDYGTSRRSRRDQRGRRPETHSPRESGSSFTLEVPGNDDRRRGVSQVRTRSPSSLSAISGASAAAAVPGGPIEKLNSIAAHFDSKLLPLCIEFTDNPPSDPKKKVAEHRRISETIMQQVILKFDEIDVSAEGGARARRKELVQEVQAILKKMDDIVKP